MPTPTLTITIAPDRDGKATLLVSARAADGTQTPPRKISVVMDGRPGAFVAAAQALARPQLAPIESSTEGRARDGDPTIAIEATHGE